MRQIDTYMYAGIGTLIGVILDLQEQPDTMIGRLTWNYVFTYRLFIQLVFYQTVWHLINCHTISNIIRSRITILIHMVWQLINCQNILLQEFVLLDYIEKINNTVQSQRNQLSSCSRGWRNGGSVFHKNMEPHI